MLNTIAKKIDGRVRLYRTSNRLQTLAEQDGTEMLRLGSAHGGWTLPRASIQPGAVAVCIGAGEDISLDVELNRQGMNVYILDPTPRARKHVANVMDAVRNGGAKIAIDRSPTEFYNFEGVAGERFHFLDAGVWNENTTMRFFAPANQEHVSHSIANLQHTQEGFDAKCLTLRSICEELSLSQIDLLKMDIEGAEYEVLRDVATHGPHPPAICVEFDEIRNPADGQFWGRIAEAVDVMKKAGYRLAHVEQSNAMFLR
jgi:FkbM family methyltransferase